MFVEAGESHHRPHFHAYYQDQSVALAIDPLEVLGGDLPTPRCASSKRGPKIHRAELASDWAPLQSGQPPVKIDPLRSRQVPVLRGELFGPLGDEDVFNQVRLDTEVGTLIWPNDADFDPTTLHDWPIVSAGFIALAESWGARDTERHNIQMEPPRR